MVKKNTADPEARFLKMTTMPVSKLIISMAIPAICSQIVTSLYNLADTYFISNIGTSAAAAPGIAQPLFMIIQAISLMLATGAASYAARRLGARDGDTANRTVSTAFFLSVIIGTVIGAVSLLLLENIMRICGATETILPYAYDYAFWVILATPFFSATFVMAFAIRQEGNVRLAVIGTVAGALLNIVLDPLLIVVFDMGIVGAAVATSVSQIVSFSILFLHIARDKCVLRLRWKFFTPSKKIIGEVLKIGSPDLFRTALLSFANILLNNSVSAYGDASLAAMTIVTKIINIIIMMLMGFGQGFQPMCGYCYGAKMYDRVKEGLKYTLKIGLLAMSAVAAAGIIFAPSVISVFRPDDAEVIEAGTRIMRAQLLVLPLATVTIISNMLFQSTGKAIKSAVVALSRNGLTFIPLILILPRLFAFNGVVWAQPIADTITFVICVFMLISMYKEFDKPLEEVVACG
ncbi:MAG TPA: MATE family efflux transporter [Eubacteriales bacterium]|nr:MATE family efflux transporter [Eubacteriales bacterium]